MTTGTALWLEPLTYWLRIEDIIPDPRIGIRLVNQAAEGQLVIEADDDVDGWIHESEGLLDFVRYEVRQAAGSDYPELLDIAMSMPQVEALESVLAAARQHESVS